MAGNVNAVNIKAGKPVRKAAGPRAAKGKRASAKAPRRDQYHHGDLPRALTDVAGELLEKDGPEAVTLRTVARRIGVSPAAVYRHFADKNALLAAVAAEGFAQLAEAFRASLADAAGQDALARLRALGLAYLRFAGDHPRLYRLLFGLERPSAQANARLARESSEAYRLLEAAAAATLPPASDAREIARAATAAWSLVHGYAMLRLEGQLEAMPAAIVPPPEAILASLIP